MARESKPFRQRNPVTIGAISLSVIATLVFLAFNAQSLPLIGGGTVYKAQFSEAAGLKPDDVVRVAGVKVGKVESLALEDGAVLVEFRVRDAFVGDRSEAAIKIETVLGAKYLALVPRGSGELDPEQPIPLERTASPYDVVEAFADLSTTVEELDTAQLASSFEVLADTFAETPDEVRTSLQGLARLSDTIASRDQQLQQLLSATRQVTQVLADRNGEFTELILDSNTLLTEVQERRALIDSILTNVQELATQLSGLVADNREALTPTLQQLSTVTDILSRNRAALAETVNNFAPFVRVFANTLGNGRWFDSFVNDLLPSALGSVVCGSVSQSPLPVGCSEETG
ncbi:MCE family protein [Blastococcus haudaquaticus]|uniref:Phospholipid/cholesterol/gamma-HCH transport system substrate-binding protein n=1 Tax=Blastococcus haudaquaticus TaxID=1938745 RepID=A0A286GF48_9ACTN|nr:MCE family protein [Blastococcus haudaquaticus]SOD94151.1 phospholipid/cholesterol/gamma-HCH transport system substrate-binding protein [Blastococcus haudaquaticus]